MDRGAKAGNAGTKNAATDNARMDNAGVRTGVRSVVHTVGFERLIGLGPGSSLLILAWVLGPGPGAVAFGDDMGELPKRSSSSLRRLRSFV